MGDRALATSTRSYRNLIVLAVLLLAAASYLLYRFVDFNEVKLAAGYYDKRITILSTSDIHGHLVYNEANGGYYTLDEVNVEMGMPLMKGIVDRIREKHPDALLLDSGDMFHGTNEANIDKAQGVLEAANLMGFDAMAAGNHDFDFGFDRLMEIKSELSFPILSANTFFNGEPAFQDYLIKEADGLRIGIFGLTVPDSLSNMNVFEQSGAIEYQDPTLIAEKVVAKLRKEGVDTIVLVSHLGDDRDKELVREVPGIDLVLSGHHHWLYKKPDRVEDSYIVEAGSYSTHVGEAVLYFRGGKVANMSWKVHQTKDRSLEDKEVLAVADKYHALALEAGKRIVGSTAVALDGTRTHVRSQETNLANALADAMREQGKADIALLNGGAIRESVPEGQLRLYDVTKPLPFVNSLVTVEVKGDKIYEALERGVRAWPFGSSNGGFLQVSGLEYRFDGSKPAGKRIISVTKDGRPLDRDKTYKVAINDYLVNGGDNYEEFKEAKALSKGDLLSTVFAKYIESKGVINPGTDGRIEVVNARYK
ncbi:bifunctional metallophosphatase/5'-nucleotidase [Cohnella cholangitidis]|uniref:Bifunctional metallophosphatase/5'-nucleotidase n=1 Tax=Cohnella cholangitidis TaxID=2598458 RepID=A0A7G5BVJ4_9BACL|nr:bifunctional UDP-sugar hydrolase/5'-nucleotidase [Cohnella cholangitidis]QMV40978.1 bifunctional metallophosphatase/5'-nucleotidase [Cohnella cholangitidis]